MRYLLAVRHNVTIFDVRLPLAEVTITQHGYENDIHDGIYDLSCQAEWIDDTCLQLDEMRNTYAAMVDGSLEQLEPQQMDDLALALVELDVTVNEVIDFAEQCYEISAMITTADWSGASCHGKDVGYMIGNYLETMGYDIGVLADGHVALLSHGRIAR